MSGSDFIFTNIIIIIYTADLPIFHLASHLHKFLISCLHKCGKSNHNRNDDVGNVLSGVDKQKWYGNADS